MAANTNRRARWGSRTAALGIAALVLVGLGVAAAFALDWLIIDGANLTIAAGAAAVLGLLLSSFALVRAGRLRAQAEQVSGEIDGVSERLLAIETRLDAFESRAADPALGATVAEVSAEIGLLGGLVRDLAVAVSAQDRDLTALKGETRGKPDRGSEARPETPWAATPRATTVQTPPATRTVVVSPAATLVAERPAMPPALAAKTAAPPVRLTREPTLPQPVPFQMPPHSVAKVGQPATPLAASRNPSPSEERERRQEAAILAAFEADRIELHLQPVVSLPQRKVQFYEALARLRLSDQSVLVPAEFLPVLERSGRLPDLDRTMLARSAAIARHLALRGSDALIACSVAPASIAEPGFLRAVGRLLDAHPDLPGRLILEVSQRCWRTLDAEQAGALAHLRDRGLAFALDRAADLRIDPLSLADRGVRYVKLAAESLLRADASKGLDLAIGDLAAVLARAGIRLIAEGGRARGGRALADRPRRAPGPGLGLRPASGRARRGAGAARSRPPGRDAAHARRRAGRAHPRCGRGTTPVPDLPAPRGLTRTGPDPTRRAKGEPGRSKSTCRVSTAPPRSCRA